MDTTIHQSFLPHDDAAASLAFCRDAPGFEVRNDVEHDGMRWITLGLPGQPDQPYGIRDCAIRDPAGTMIRIQEAR